MSGREQLLTPLRAFASCFLVTRLLEAAWIIVVLALALAVEHGSSSPEADRWKYWSVLGTIHASFAAVVWYYLGLSYILVSAAAHFVARHAWIGLSARRYAALNVGILFAHSVLVIASVFRGQLTLALWTAWSAAILYNVLVPARLWRSFIK